MTLYLKTFIWRKTGILWGKSHVSLTLGNMTRFCRLIGPKGYIPSGFYLFCHYGLPGGAENASPDKRAAVSGDSDCPR